MAENKITLQEMLADYTAEPSSDSLDKTLSEYTDGDFSEKILFRYGRPDASLELMLAEYSGQRPVEFFERLVRRYVPDASGEKILQRLREKRQTDIIEYAKAVDVISGGLGIPKTFLTGLVAAAE